MKRKIILDCDPGHDDAVGIMMAAGADNIDICGITVVSGNQILDKTVNNTLNICQYLNLNIPVYAGCARPILKTDNIDASFIHGESGIDGVRFEKLKKQKEPEHAVEFICRTLLETKEKITLVMTGPLTNLAFALRMYPQIVENIDEVVIMGGSAGKGNITELAEFNMFSDAEAAQIVFSSNLKIIMIGLNVTTKVLCNKNRIDKIREINNKASVLFCDMMNYYCNTIYENFGLNGVPLHDPLTVSYLMDKSVVALKPMKVSICSDKLQYGKTECIENINDFNALVANEVDDEKFWKLAYYAISKLI